MDKLKNFIDTNKEAFEDDLLPEGHFERFEKKLPAPRKSHLTLYALSAFAVAASITLLLILRLPGGTTVPGSDPESTFRQTACDNREEIDELRLYYNMQINDIMARMEALYKQEKAPGAAGLLQESKRILKDNYQFEETVLPTLPCSNDGLYAMNQHYTNSLEGLNIMLKQMQQVTNKQEENNK